MIMPLTLVLCLYIFISNKSFDPDDIIYVRSMYVGGNSEPNSGICVDGGSGLKLIILVTSAPTHEANRMAIRETWGNVSHRQYVAIGFYVGSTRNATEDIQLKIENNIYKDIIRGNFIDSYHNLTLKTISMLEWTHRYCSQVKYLLKTDDDVFINVPKLLAFVDDHLQDNMTLFGYLYHKSAPYRAGTSKYVVSRKQFGPRLFPDFLSGPAYLVSSDLVHKMYNAALDKPFLHLEDVFMTGIVGPAVGAKLIDVENFNQDISYKPGLANKCYSVHFVTPLQQYYLQNQLTEAEQLQYKGKEV